MPKLYKAAIAIIFNNEGKVLFSKRFEPKHIPSHGKWQFPGGGIEKGETPAMTAIRETQEEANIRITLLTQDPIVRTEATDDTNKVYIELYGFPAKYVSGTISCDNDPESSEIGWFDVFEIDYNQSLPGTFEFAMEALKIWKKDL